MNLLTLLHPYHFLDLSDVMHKLHETFIALAAQLHEIHEAVKVKPGFVIRQPANPFEGLRQSERAKKKASAEKRESEDWEERSNGEDFSALFFPSPCLFCPGNYGFLCPGPIRRFPTPSRSIHFGDATEENRWTTCHETYWPRGIIRFWGLGNDFPKLSWLLPNTLKLYTYDRRVRLKTAWGKDPHCTSSEQRKHQFNNYAAD